jgi:hypothetical protein
VPSTGGGFALVSRVAVAHVGGAWIDDQRVGGARVGFGVEALDPGGAPSEMRAG